MLDIFNLNYFRTSLKKTDAVQNVPEGSLVSLVVHVELAVARAHLNLAFTCFAQLFHVVAQGSAAAKIGHVGLRDACSLLVHKYFQGFDVPVLLKLLLRLVLLRLNLSLSCVGITTNPPLEFRNLVLLDLCSLLQITGLSHCTGRFLVHCHIRDVDVLASFILTVFAVITYCHW